MSCSILFFFFFQAEDGIRDKLVTGVQTCALPISIKDLARFLRFEDPEVRYWAAERLARHYTKEAADLLAPYLFDEHDLTPELVASHLGRHGGGAHLPVLARGVKTQIGRASCRERV